MSKAYLPRDSRKDVSFSLTERDVEILKAVNRYRYMRTSQIWQLIFPDNQTIQAPTRRLKYLYHGGFLGRIQPLLAPGRGTSGEIAYYLDQAGQELLAEYGEDVHIYAKSGQVKRIFLQHALDLSEFRLCIEKALEKSEVVQLHRFVCDFETKKQTENAIGKKRYKLYEEVSHPVSRERFVVYPDGLIILKGRGAYEKFQRLYFLEIDRGTETLERIRQKVIGYNIYLKENIYKKFGAFDGFKVLIQTSSEKRAENIRKHLVDQDGAEVVLVSAVQDVNVDSILTDPIWLNEDNKKTPLMKRS